MSRVYIKFSCIGEPTDPNKCTSRWAEGITCSIPIGGTVSGSFYNLMIMEGDILSINSWLSENAGKVEAITKEDADLLGQMIVVPGTEIVNKDMTSGEEVIMVAGVFDVDNPNDLWTVKI